MTGRLNKNFKKKLFWGTVTAAVVAILVVMIFAVKDAATTRIYNSYRIECESEKTGAVEDSVLVSKYEYADGAVVAYSRDGASLINAKLETKWSFAYSMSDPRVDVRGDRILIYDLLGNQLYLCNGKGLLGSFSTELPILMGRVSENDTAAVLMRDEDKVELVYYNERGERIAAGTSSMKDPGYPLSMSLSDDGEMLAVSYLTAVNGSAGSTVRFFNFGSGGREKPNNMVGEVSYDGILVPEVRYLKGGSCVLFREDGFTIVRGRKAPDEVKTEQFSSEICSVFCDDRVVGVVMHNDAEDCGTVMRIYSADGESKCSTKVDLSYDRVRVSGGQVIFSGRTEFAVYSTDGYLRFEGMLNEGMITDALRIGRNRFLILTDKRMEVISLK